MFSWIPLCRFLHAKSLLECVEDVSKLHMCMRWNTRYTLNGDYLERFRRNHCVWQPTVCGNADDQVCFMDQFYHLDFIQQVQWEVCSKKSQEDSLCIVIVYTQVKSLRNLSQRLLFEIPNVLVIIEIMFLSVLYFYFRQYIK